jgi:hypothetical protein
MSARICPGFVSTTCPRPLGCGWVWNAARVVGGGLAHCWVLKHQALIALELSREGWVGGVWGWWFWSPPFVSCPAVCGVRGVGGVVV